MVELYGITPDRLIYDELFLNQSGYNHHNALPSAYNFLLANLETYPEWVFKPLERQNIFGI